MNNTTKKKVAAGILAAVMTTSAVVIPSLLYADTPQLKDEDITEANSFELPSKIGAGKIGGYSFVKMLSNSWTGGNNAFNNAHGSSLYFDNEFAYDIPWLIYQSGEYLPFDYTYYDVTLDADNDEYAPLYCIDLNAKPPIEISNGKQTSVEMVLNPNGFSKIALANITKDNIESSTLMLAPLLYGYPMANNIFSDPVNGTASLTPGELKWATSVGFKIISGKVYNPDKYDRSDYGYRILDFYENDKDTDSNENVLTSLLPGISEQYTKRIGFMTKTLDEAGWNGLYTNVLSKVSGSAKKNDNVFYKKVLSGYTPDKTHSGQVVGAMSIMLYGAFDIASDNGNFERTLHLESPVTPTEYKLDTKTYVGPYIAHINQGTKYSSKTTGTANITNSLLKDTILVSITGNPSNVYIGKADGTAFPKDGNNYLVKTEEEFYVFNTSNETKAYSISLDTKNIKNVRNAYYQSNSGTPTQRMLMYSPIPLTGKFSVSFSEEKLGSVKLTKVNSLSGEPLSGATFTLTSSKAITYKGENVAAGTPIGGAKTSADNGIISWDELPMGTYTLTETRAPQGYIESSYTKEVVVSENTPNVDIGNVGNTEKGSISIVKINSITKEKMNGVLFDIYDASNNKVAEMTTDANGTASVTNLLPGIYTLVEHTPVGFIDNGRIQVEVKADSTTNLHPTQTIENSPFGKLTVIKKDVITNELLPGAEFTVATNAAITYNGQNYNANDVIATVVTDENGSTIVEDLPYGAYTVVETKAPNGYQTPNYREVVNISDESLNTLYKTVEISNTPYGSLTIIKEDNSTKEKLEGAVFELRANETLIYENKTYNKDDVILEETTPANGIITIEDLPCASYSIIETKAPEGYSLDNTPKTVVISKDSLEKLNVTVNIPNTKTGALKVVKTDATNNDRLKGATFNIKPNFDTEYNGENYKAGDIIATLTTAEGGEAIIENLKPGEYTVEEIQAPDGYSLNEQSVVVTVDGNVASIPIAEVRNIPFGKFSLTKYDADTREKLAGAEFELIVNNDVEYNDKEYSAGSVLATLITDENGNASIDNLPYANYVVKEIKAPEDYDLDSTEHSFEIKEENDEASTKVHIDVDNTKTAPEYGQFSLTKYDADTREKLAGAEFELTVNNNIEYNGKNYTAGSVLATLITDENGNASIDNLPYAHYVIKETKAPEDYNLDGTEHSFEIKEGSDEASVNVHLDVDNTKNSPEFGSFSIIKTNPNKDIPIIAQFDLVTKDRVYYNEQWYEAGYSILKDFKTDAEGKYQSPPIPVGSYYLRETDTQEGFLLPEGPILEDIKITANSNAQSLVLELTNYEENVYGQFIVYKEDKDTKERLPNAKFEITDSNGNYVDTIISNEDGIAYSGELEFGIYYVQEIEAPEGYEIDSQKHKVEITGKETETVSITIENKKIEKGKIKIIKVDANDKTKTISNVSFKIYDKNNKLIETINTDNKGEALSSELDFDTYVIEEVTTPSGYVINSEKITVNLTKENSYQEEYITTVIVENQPIVGKIKVIKIEEGNKERKLPGAVFEVYDSNNNLVQTLTTDANGEAETNELPLGKYTIKETKAPDGYVKKEALYNAELTEGDKTSPIVYTSVLAENQKIQKGKIELLKIDEKTNELLSGAEFDVISEDSGDIVAKLITDSNGKASTGLLPLGTYIIKETKAPNGYVITVTKPVVILKADATVEVPVEIVTVKNRKEATPYGNIEVIKKDSKNKKPLGNVTFDIYTKQTIVYNGVTYNADQVIAKIKTDKNGSASLANLPLGKYYALETGSYDGYKANTKKYEFDINETNFNNVQTQTVFNTPTEVVITKYDITNSKPLAGATITIYDSYGDKVFEDETDSDGEIHAFRLEAGDYTFKETVAPDGYIINDTEFEFTIDENGKVKGDHDVSDKPTEVIITKKDLTTGLPLAGATITIVDANGKIVFKEVSGPNGEVKAMRLKPGKYTFTEQAAPDGYTRNPESFEFELFEDGTVRGDCTITDRPTEVVITKKDFTTGAPLAGATIEITDSNGNIVFKEVSGPNGEVKAMKLKPGKYTFKETAAPDGYTRNPETFEFELFEDGTVRGDCTITDRPTEVVITKKDFTTAAPLPGATIQIIDSNGKLAFEGVTGEDGTIRAFKLSPGKYTFKEISAPAGYQLNVETFNFELFEDGTCKGDHEIYDKRVPNIKTGVESAPTSRTVAPIIVAVILLAAFAIFKVSSKKDNK